MFFTMVKKRKMKMSDKKINSIFNHFENYRPTLKTL